MIPGKYRGGVHNAAELRDEFGRLFEEMVEEIIYLMGQCSQLGMPVVTSVTSTSKKIIKVRKSHFGFSKIVDISEPPSHFKSFEGLSILRHGDSSSEGPIRPQNAFNKRRQADCISVVST